MDPERTEKTWVQEEQVVLCKVYTYNMQKREHVCKELPGNPNEIDTCSKRKQEEEVEGYLRTVKLMKRP